MKVVKQFKLKGNDVKLWQGKNKEGETVYILTEKKQFV